MGRDIQFRSVNEFFESGTFSVPGSGKEAMERVELNGQYYQANYAAIVIVCLLYASFAVPPFGMALIVVGGAGAYLFGVLPSPRLPTGNGESLTEQQTLAGYALISLILLAYTGQQQSAIALLIAVIAVASHMLLRQRSLKARGTNAVDDARRAASDPLRSIAHLVDSGSSSGSGSGSSRSSSVRSQ